MFHYFQNLSPDYQYYDDFYHSQNSNAFMISTISDYDLGGEGDLFKAPTPIVEQPSVTIDHMTSAMSMILCGEEVESLQIDDLFSEYNNILANETSSPSEVLNFELPTTKGEMEEKIIRSARSMNLSSMEIRPSCIDFNEIELKEVYGMPRVLSEGYIKPQLIGDHHTTETRLEKLLRYRDKKTKRNFGRKIKYACRKVLADGQPRIRGRFAKTE